MFHGIALESSRREKLRMNWSTKILHIRSETKFVKDVLWCKPSASMKLVEGRRYVAKKCNGISSNTSKAVPNSKIDDIRRKSSAKFMEFQLNIGFPSIPYLACSMWHSKHYFSCIQSQRTHSLGISPLSLIRSGIVSFYHNWTIFAIRSAVILSSCHIRVFHRSLPLSYISLTRHHTIHSFKSLAHCRSTLRHLIILHIGRWQWWVGHGQQANKFPTTEQIW